MRGNVLNLDPITEERDHRKHSYKEGAAPDLKDSPLQKDFIYSLEQFEQKLIIVTVLSLVVVAIGILGTYLCKSCLLYTSDAADE